MASKLDIVALRFLTLPLFLWTAPASSHTRSEAQAVFSQWTFEPWVMWCLGLFLAAYVAGALRLRKRMRHGRRPLARHCLAFFAGWLTLAIALVSPLDALGGWLFSAHMLQHELMMIVAAPLLVLGRPLGIGMWAFSANLRQVIALVVHAKPVALSWHVLVHPLIAWLLHAAVLWLWHLPRLFEAALSAEPVHAVQHCAFLLSALLFWWTAIGEDPLRPSRAGAMFYLFTTMLHTGALGALLAVSETAWYPAYSLSSSAFGLTPLEDQQLGGLIMWVPGGVAYLAAGLMLGAQCLAHGTRPLTRSGGERGA